jgi:hypothetical protein
MAPAPISGRTSAGAVWTGSEMIVWGGVTRTSTGGQMDSDGAAYDPVANSWKTIAPAPAGLAGGGGQAAAWTGKDAVFWVGNSPDGPAGGAVYDPATDSWRSLPAGPLGVREGYVSVWTGTRLLIMGGVAGDQLATPIGASVDPATGSWKPLKALDALTGFLPSGAVWDGTNVFVMGNQSQCPEQGSSCQTYRPRFVSYTPAGDTIRQISLTGVPVDKDTLGTLVPTAWTPDHRVLFTSGGDAGGAPVQYDPATNTWSTGPAPKCAPADPMFGQTAWIGDSLIAPCGRQALQVFFVTGHWMPFVTGPSPMNSRVGSVVVWTGKDLIAWSGSSKRSGEVTVPTGSVIDLSEVATTDQPGLSVQEAGDASG